MPELVSEIKDALRDSLERRGVLKDMQARMRAEIFAAMDDPEDARLALSKENMLINEMIREYLAFNDYRHTLSVFQPETGMAAQPLPRSYVAMNTSISASTPVADDLPLLYSLVAPHPQSTKVTCEQRILSQTASGATPPPPAPATMVAPLPSHQRRRMPDPSPIIFTPGPA